MEQKQQKRLLWGIGVYAAIFLLLLWAVNVSNFNRWFASLLLLLRPLLIGLTVAYICNPFFRFFERKLFYKIHPNGLRRGISLFFTYLTLFLIIALLLLLIVPQLIDSILNFAENVDEYFANTVTDLNSFINRINKLLPNSETNPEGVIPLIDPAGIKEKIQNLIASWKSENESLLNFVNTDTIGRVLAIAEDVVDIITDTIFGFFISLYLLNSKEKRYAQIMRFRRAFFSDRTNNLLTKICTTADRTFGGFLRGKILDSAIVGVMVYIVISIIHVPYAPLIAVTVAITDIVPVIGPFIGVFPSAVIILLTDPGKVIPFLICILIIQQIDGNILAPKVLGENTGVSSLCVLISITTMGALWGLVGMIVGVPLFATVLELTNEFLDRRLQKKGLSTATDDYYTPELAGEHLATEPSVPATEAPNASDGGTGDFSAAEHNALRAYRHAKENGLTTKAVAKNANSADSHTSCKDENKD